MTTPSTAAEAGLSRSALYRAAKAGEHARIARGIYLPADAAVDWELVEAAMRRPEATVCLTSALVHHELSDVVPDSLDVAIPRGARVPATDAAIDWHLFDADSYAVGRMDMAIPESDLSTGIYTPERCIVDCFRLREQMGYESGREALKEWLRRGGRPTALMDIAEQFP